MAVFEVLPVEDEQSENKFRALVGTNFEPTEGSGPGTGGEIRITPPFSTTEAYLSELSVLDRVELFLIFTGNISTVLGFNVLHERDDDALADDELIASRTERVMSTTEELLHELGRAASENLFRAEFVGK